MTGTSPDGSQRGHDSTAARADAGWKAGLARGKITPPPLVVLLVFGDHTVPFNSIVADIHTKTLALKDSHGHRLVIVTADLIGFQVAVVTALGIVPSTVSTTVSNRALGASILRRSTHAVPEDCD